LDQVNDDERNRVNNQRDQRTIDRGGDQRED